MNYKYRIIIIMFLMILSSCASNRNNPKIIEKVCTEPRSPLCTRDYRPVCAQLVSGLFKTYSNGCTACADDKVISWVDLKCDNEQLSK